MPKLDRAVLAPVVDALADATVKHFYQREHLTVERVHKWISDVLADQRFDDKSAREAAEEIKWLVRRGSGLSGSEIAPLVLDKFNRFHPFSTTREVVAQKLFMWAPYQDPRFYVDTQRGHKIEDIARARFHEIAPSMGLRPNDDIVNALRKFRHPTIRSMIGTPDEAADDLRNENTIVIADYKAPRPNGKPLEPRDFSALATSLLTPDNTEILPVDETDGKLFDYYLQMHQYAILERERRKDPDVNIRLLLIRWCGVRGDIVIDELPWSEEIAQLICQTHQEVWEGNIMNGLLPDMVMRTKLDKRNVPEDLEELSSHFVMAKVLEKAAKKMIENIQGQFEAWVNTTGFLDSKLMLGYLDIKGRAQYDPEALEQLARHFGIDPDDFRGASKTIDNARTLEEIAAILEDDARGPEKLDDVQRLLDSAPVVPGKLNSQKLADEIVRQGGDPTSLRNQGFTFSLPRGKNERALTLATVSDLSKQMFDAVVATSISKGPDEMAAVTANFAQKIDELREDGDLSTAELIDRVNEEIALAITQEEASAPPDQAAQELELDGSGDAPAIQMPAMRGGFPARPAEEEVAEKTEEHAPVGSGFSALRVSNDQDMLYEP